MIEPEESASDWRGVATRLDEEVDRLRARLLALASVLPPRYHYYLHHDAPSSAPTAKDLFGEEGETAEPQESDVLTELDRLWRRL